MSSIEIETETEIVPPEISRRPLHTRQSPGESEKQPDNERTPAVLY